MQSTHSRTLSLSYQSSSSSLDVLISPSAVGANPGSSLSFMKGDDMIIGWKVETTFLINERVLVLRSSKKSKQPLEP
ncbi:hypothetical protein Tco_0563658 [Tanacetum coccineum]